MMMEDGLSIDTNNKRTASPLDVKNLFKPAADYTETTNIEKFIQCLLTHRRMDYEELEEDVDTVLEMQLSD